MSTTEAGRREDLSRQGSVVSGMTLVSRISGFVRDVLLSAFFGATGTADAFFVAFRIPNFFRRLFAEGAFSQAFVPVLMGYVAGERDELKRFLSVVFGNLGLALAVFVTMGIAFAPVLVRVFAPGFADGDPRYLLATDLVRITFPYLGFIALTAFASGVLNAHGRFAVPAIAPVLLNLSLIAAALWGTRVADPAVNALAWGVFVAGVLQLAFVSASVARLQLVVAPRLSRSHPGVRQLGVLLVPAVFAASVHQVNSLVDTMLASTLTTGSISWLYYSDRLLELPVGLVAVALGTVLLPNLSRLALAGRDDDFAATLGWGVRMGVLIAIPAACGLYYLATPLVATIFYHGALTAFDVKMAALSLQAFAVGLPGWVLVKVLAPAYFAHKDTRTPLRYATVAVLVNIVLNLALYRHFGHVGLAFATSASGWTNAILLWSGLVLRERVQHAGLPLWVGRTLLGLAGMVIALYALQRGMSDWVSATVFVRIWQLTLLIVAGAVVYGAVVWLAGVRFADLRHRVASDTHAPDHR